MLALGGCTIPHDGSPGPWGAEVCRAHGGVRYLDDFDYHVRCYDGTAR